MKPKTLAEAKAWLDEDRYRLDRWNHLRDRACCVSLSISEAAEWIVAMNEETFQQLKEQVA